MWKSNSNRKYGGKKIKRAGMRFDSKLETALWDQLKLREIAGEISELKHHPGTVFLSEARIQYRPDFMFREKYKDWYSYAEAKGFANDKWPIKKKLWKHYGPGILYIYGGSYNRLVLTETIIPKGN